MATRLGLWTRVTGAGCGGVMRASVNWTGLKPERTVSMVEWKIETRDGAMVAVLTHSDGAESVYTRDKLMHVMNYATGMSPTYDSPADYEAGK